MKLVCPYCFKEIITPYCVCSSISVRHKQKIGSNDDYVPKKIKFKLGDYVPFCKECGAHTSYQCEHCREHLPKTAQTLLAALCGVRGSGKTYYIGTVIRKLTLTLNKLVPSVGLAQNSEKDHKNYQNLLYQIDLRDVDNTKVEDLILPMLYNVDTGQRSKPMTISFVDKAGEVFEKELLLEKHAPYLVNSDVFVVVVDPLNITHVRKTLISEKIPFKKWKNGEEYALVSDKEPNDAVITRIINVYRKQAGMAQGKKIKIPIIVAFSKWDYIEKSLTLKPDHFDLSAAENQVVTNGKFSLNTFVNNSKAIEEFLLQCGEDESNFMTLLNLNFDEVYYCAFSAYGTETHVNEKGNETIPPISPATAKHVEDPFLWLLHKKKIIK